jgi:hypothetical protein
MLAMAINGDHVVTDAGNHIDGNHQVGGAEAEEPTALDLQEPHLLLILIDHQAIYCTDVVPRIIQDFSAPDVLVGVGDHLAAIT